MRNGEILAALGAEIARLQQVRNLLSGQGTRSPIKAQGGRTIGNALAAKKRTLSPEGRERIAAAQRKRWAKVKKASK
jgi:hypothetical protein